MKFGVREICDVVFKALQEGKMGNMAYKKGQPVLYIDSAKTSTIEGASNTVYAQGGRGNARLIAWEGEKTLTFTVEDALLSEIGFAVLSGAGLFEGLGGTNGTARVHCTELVYASNEELPLDKTPATDSPIFVMKYENGSIGNRIYDLEVTTNTDGKSVLAAADSGAKEDVGTTEGADHTLSGQYFVDYYTTGESFTSVNELNIDAENFAGYYYVEASTLFRRESDGVDLPAEIVFPKVKIQSNFTFNMSSSGDPSTFTFTMDAMPAYTMFQKDKKVLCAIQVIDDGANVVNQKAVTTMDADEQVEKEVLDNDSSVNTNFSE